ncbi:MAG: homocysteine S-methyltransferase family protein [Granulosicoccus sp.]
MEVRILDGGLGQELIARTGKVTSLWSTQALLDDPDVVRQVHADFFAAGAEVATANTYSLLPDRLVARGLDSRLEELTKLACVQACKARDVHGKGLVAGSLGPLGFSYQPDKCPSAEEAAEIYHRVCKAQESYVDFYIAETMASVEQTKGVLAGASGFGKPMWVAVTVDDNDGTLLRSKEPLSSLFPLLSEYNVEVVLINCSTPESVTRGVPCLVNQGLDVGAYANGFTGINDKFNSVGATVDLLEVRTDLGPVEYAEFASAWVAEGATIIGGCCEVGPAHIKELSRRFGSM